MAEQTGPVWYEIRVRGLLGKTLLGAFPGMCARADEVRRYTRIFVDGLII